MRGDGWIKYRQRAGCDGFLDDVGEEDFEE